MRNDAERCTVSLLCMEWSKRHEQRTTRSRDEGGGGQQGRPRQELFTASWIGGASGPRIGDAVRLCAYVRAPWILDSARARIHVDMYGSREKLILGRRPREPRGRRCPRGVPGPAPPSRSASGSARVEIVSTLVCTRVRIACGIM